MESSEPPPIAALFEVVFDQKVGYTLGWKRTLPGLDLSGVEFKCLPSGLHSVKEDLVYFVHGSYAGVSAFVQEKADEAHRNANLITIGALVPLTYERLGKSWRHAAELRRLAREKVKGGQDCRALELFWRENKADDNAVQDTPSSPSLLRASTTEAGDGVARKRKRARSDASANLSSNDFLTADHPALSMPSLLKNLGPLIFPLHRAALLRKRILVLASPPVQESCNIIYNLSILSSLPRSLASSLQLSPTDETLLRIQTLFSVGVHDIPYLKTEARKSRWLACTTDDILSEKKDLYDIIVKFPTQQSSAQATTKYPQVLTSEGKEIKATQRDLRRYRLLRSELKRSTQPPAQHYRDDPTADTTSNSDNTSEDDPAASLPLIRASTTTLLNEVHTVADPGDHLVCEPVTWTAMAYNGFMWWASAGEVEAWENEQARADRELLDEVPEASDLLRHIDPSSDANADDNEDDEDESQLRQKMAEATVLTAYFHRLSHLHLQPLADLVEDADDDTVEGVADEDEILAVECEDVRAMGLDVWSAGDREFVVEAAALYFGRQAAVGEGEGVRVCGVRVC